METGIYFIFFNYSSERVRMEVFPERDGNTDGTIEHHPAIVHESEWRSSLKGMETTRSGPKLGSVPSFVRMEVFPERDGNVWLSAVVACCLARPNGGLP